MNEIVGEIREFRSRLFDFRNWIFLHTLEGIFFGLIGVPALASVRHHLSGHMN